MLKLMLVARKSKDAFCSSYSVTYPWSLFHFVAEICLWTVLRFEGGAQGDNQSLITGSLKYRGRRAASCFLISQETKRPELPKKTQALRICLVSAGCQQLEPHPTSGSQAICSFFSE